MSMEGMLNESEREEDKKKAETMAYGSDWQHTKAAKVRAGDKTGSMTAEELEEGAASAERLSSTEYDAEKEAAEMNNDELKEAVRVSKEEADAERAVNPEYVIGNNLDHLTIRAVAFAKEAENRRKEGKY